MDLRHMRIPGRQAGRSAFRASAAALAALASTCGAATVNVRMSGDWPTGTVVRVSLFDAAGYARRRPTAESSVRIESADARVRFDGLAPGGYGARAFADVNGNGRLDRTPYGLPAEPLGFTRAASFRRGPPAFESIRIDAFDGEHVETAVAPIAPPRYEPWAVGLGAVLTSRPYKDADARFVPMPIVAYHGLRLQVFGPVVRYELLRSGPAALAAAAAYRVDGYESDDAPIFEGLPDRSDTVEAGLHGTCGLAPGVRADASWKHDVLDRHGGSRADLALRATLPVGPILVTPEAAVDWISAEAIDYYYGVPAPYAAPGRPAYAPDDAWQPRAGLGLASALGGKWFGTIRLSGAYLSSEIRDSPLVDEEWEWRLLLSVTRSL
jgi:outer membrane protein